MSHILPQVSRREFMKGCCAAAAVAGVPTMLYSGSAHAANGYDTLVHIFLRGGIDGLNLVVPISGNDRVHYEQARPSLNIAVTGAYGALPLLDQASGATLFGLHPSASGLHDIWNEGHLAIVHACGLKTTVTRSHFDAQLYYDLGTPGQHGTPNGWISRAWASAAVSGQEMPILAVNSRSPANILGATEALTMTNTSDFALNTSSHQWRQSGGGRPAGVVGVNDILSGYLSGMGRIDRAGVAAKHSIDVIGQQGFTSTLPAGWPTSNFARQLWTVAQSIRFDLGLRYAALDLGGWDTHEGQGTAGSGYHYYQNKIAELSQALTAFYVELAAGGELGRTTVIVQSEFGRRVRQNGSSGTDHGYGNPLLVMGGAVNGGRFYGQWSGLDPDILAPYFGDVPVNTDYRQVFSELLVDRMNNNQLQTVFPGYEGHVPLGIFQPQTQSVSPPLRRARG